MDAAEDEDEEEGGVGGDLAAVAALKRVEDALSPTGGTAPGYGLPPLGPSK